MKTRYSDIKAYTTKDGSIIRELMHPDSGGSTQQSLAEAQVMVGAETVLHRHQLTEELYYITGGCGLMILADDAFEVKVGDSVLIEPGTPHKIRNIGDEVLSLLCCCSPPYSHDDTELLGGADLPDEPTGK